jgi:glycosyltransferase involved in cell wall biosynthesis
MSNDAPEVPEGDLPAGRPPRVALVAYFYPPLGGVAVARTLGFVRHLPRAGWQPVVIAPAGSPYLLRDLGAVEDPDRPVEVYRTPSPEPAHLARAARVILAAVRRASTLVRASDAAGPGTSGVAASDRAAPAPSAATNRPSTTGGARAAGGPWPGRIRRAIWFPDDQAGWLPFAVGTLVTAHQRDPVSAIVSSSSPVTAHVAAWVASRLIRVPWVADFRDPWLDNPIEPPSAGLGRWRRATLEHALVRSATRCTFATPSLMAAYARRYPRLAWRFSVLPNGYEMPEPVAVTSPTATLGTPRRLVYAGSLYRPRELDVFLAGVARLAAGRPAIRAELEIVFVGTVTSECRAVADTWLTDPVLASVVSFRGFVPRAEATSLVAGADAALTLLGDGPGMEMFVGAKLYDYLALDRQVVAMVPPGDARDVLADLGWGIVADPEPGAVAAALARFLDEPPPDRPADPGRRYARAAVAGRLARLLDDLTTRRTAR